MFTLSSSDADTLLTPVGSSRPAISSDLDTYFRPGVLSKELRADILAYLCFSSELVPLPTQFLAGLTDLNFGGCVLPRGLFAQIASEAPNLVTIDLKQCSGHEMLLPDGFREFCAKCQQLEKISLVSFCFVVAGRLSFRLQSALFATPTIQSTLSHYTSLSLCPLWCLASSCIRKLTALASLQAGVMTLSDELLGFLHQQRFVSTAISMFYLSMTFNF